MGKRILITGGTVFVSKFAAEYFVKRGYEVSVLNRGSRPQVSGVEWICADRNQLNGVLQGKNFDHVLDITAYTKEDVKNLLAELKGFSTYILISSSAVYPETLPQPFSEEQPVGYNSIWRKYGSDKIEAEEYLMEKVPDAYVIRPPYLYGSMNDVYREAFVFDCALQHRKFYMPGDGSQKLQFFHVEDLCRLMEAILEKRPEEHIFNVGNEAIDIRTFVELCYQAAGESLRARLVEDQVCQTNYFCFPAYEYVLDVKKQKELLPDVKDFYEGLREAFAWYCENKEEVERREYIEYIENEMRG